MYSFLMIIFSIISLMLMTIILIQPGRGQGLVGMFTSENMQSMLGARALDVLEKITWGFVVVFFGMTVLLSVMTSSNQETLVDKISDIPAAAPQTPTAPQPISATSGQTASDEGMPSSGDTLPIQTEQTPVE